MKLLSLVAISIAVFCSCGANTNKKDDLADSIIINLSNRSNVIVNASIMEVTTGWSWDFGQIECTVFARINSVIKGRIKSGDTIAFILTNDNLLKENEQDSIQLKKNGDYILCLLETTGMAQLGEESNNPKSQPILESTDSGNFAHSDPTLSLKNDPSHFAFHPS